MKCHRNQMKCNDCIQNEPYDLIIDCGDFHAELHTEAMTRKNLSKLLANVSRLAKQIEAEKGGSYKDAQD